MLLPSTNYELVLHVSMWPDDHGTPPDPEALAEAVHDLLQDTPVPGDHEWSLDGWSIRPVTPSGSNRY